MSAPKRPNVLYIFADQWRADALGYAGDPNVKTPHIDRLARQSVNFTHAISGCPVCTPARGSILTGQRPLTHGLFMNDVPLNPAATTIGKVFKAGGYDTAYIGKWHVDGHGRSGHIPPERRQGFDYWKVLECTHDYNSSHYYDNVDRQLSTWDGYDAIVQTRDACEYIRQRDSDKPFLLMMSWGPPHAPYETAPETYRAMYDADALTLRPNVPEDHPHAREWHAGYYAHCTALDDCVAELLAMLDEQGIADDTVFVFTSDHGDMLGCQNDVKKQRPWDESLRVPFLLRYPGMEDWKPGETDAKIDVCDLMPTLLDLAGLDIPETVEGVSFAGHLAGGDDPKHGVGLFGLPAPFGQYLRRDGGREYRGVRTTRHTYVRDLDGPWLLYDNHADPYQMTNLIDRPEHAETQAAIDAELNRQLEAAGDEFLHGDVYIERWGYEVDETGTVPYRHLQPPIGKGQ